MMNGCSIVLDSKSQTLIDRLNRGLVKPKLTSPECNVLLNTDWKSDQRMKKEEEEKKKELVERVSDHIIMSRNQLNNKLTLRVLTKPSYRYRNATNYTQDHASTSQMGSQGSKSQGKIRSF